MKSKNAIKNETVRCLKCGKLVSSAGGLMPHNSWHKRKDRINQLKLFLLLLVLAPLVSASSQCFDFQILGSSNNNLTGIVLGLTIPSNLSLSVNVTSWSNVRVYNSSCLDWAVNSSSELPYEVDSFNETGGYFWFKSDLSKAWSWTSFSVLVFDNQSMQANESPSIVWSDYRHVYHFSESSGNFTKDSAGNNSVFMYDSISNSSKALNFVSSDFFGNSLSFNNLDCAISEKNTTLDLSGFSSRSVFVWEHKLGISGDDVHQHGQLFALGTPTSGNYYNIRDDELTNVWELNYNGYSWNTGTIPDFSPNFHYLGLRDRKVWWFINNDYLGFRDFFHDTSSAPIQVGGAWAINAPWNGCVGVFNGTIDELRISNKTFSDSYVRRTNQLTNSSTWAFTNNISSLPDYSNNSIIEDQLNFTAIEESDNTPHSSSGSYSSGGGSGGSLFPSSTRAVSNNSIIEKNDSNNEIVVNDSKKDNHVINGESKTSSFTPKKLFLVLLIILALLCFYFWVKQDIYEDYPISELNLKI